MSAKKTPEEKLADKLRSLLAMMGSDNAGERENARSLLNDILLKHKKNWNDLVELMRTGDAGDWGAVDDADDRAGKAAPTGDIKDVMGDTKIHALSLVYRMLELYVGMEPNEYVATALWVLHTHVYDRFTVSPRLATTSPVRGCGKTTLLDVLAALVPRPRKADSISAAAIYRLVDREHCTLLVDEADNLGLHADGPLRATFNSGHRKGGRIVRGWKDGVRDYAVYSPMAIAAIGYLPLPISHRSIAIHMTRYAGAEPLRRFDSSDTADLNVAYRYILDWRAKVKLNLDPDMPNSLRNRQADNWRPLIAIADTFGAQWGKAARKAALAFARGHRDEDIGVVLLRDIRHQFDLQDADRFTSVGLVAALNAMDDAPWSEWRGIRDDQSPRKLSPGELAKILAPFRIRPRSIWPATGKRAASGKGSSKGYLRAQFEHAWAAYCSEGDTPAQPSNINMLRGD